MLGGHLIIQELTIFREMVMRCDAYFHVKLLIKNITLLMIQRVLVYEKSQKVPLSYLLLGVDMLFGTSIQDREIWALIT